MCDVIMTSFMTSLEGHVTTPYKRGVAREYPSVHGEPSKWADVRRCDPSGRNSANYIKDLFGERGIVTFSFTNLILLALVGNDYFQ